MPFYLHIYRGENYIRVLLKNPDVQVCNILSMNKNSYGSPAWTLPDRFRNIFALCFNMHLHLYHGIDFGTDVLNSHAGYYGLLQVRIPLHSLMC